MQTADLKIQNDLADMFNRIKNLVYGFAYAGDLVSDKFKSLPYAVSIGIPLTPSVIDDIAAGPTRIYYDEYLSVNDELDAITQRTQEEIENRGHHAYAVASSKRTDFVHIKGEFPHKAAAVRCGLGWIGKSSLLITRKYGPRLRLSTVLTDVAFTANHLLEENHCGGCKRCANACPAGAIAGTLWNMRLSREDLIDVNKCDHWKIKNYPQFHGQVCGICVAVCPHGARKDI